MKNTLAKMWASQRVHQRIGTQSTEGSLLLGDPIDEERLRGRFGVSRTPMREALLQLQAEGRAR